MRTLVIMTAAVAGGVAIAAAIAWSMTTVVPDSVYDTLFETQEIFEGVGLIGVVRSAADDQTPLIDQMFVVDVEPPPGSRVFRGTKVMLTLEPPDEAVVVPDLLGRFEDDAIKLLSERGLLAPSKPRQVSPDGEPLYLGDIVHSQEPSAGAVVSWGTTVMYEASYPHSPEGTAPEVRKVHGLMYLRYGIEGMGACSVCHTSRTCLGAKCHSASAYEYLDGVTSEAE